MANNDSEMLTITEATRLLKVGRTTLHRWLKSGRLRAYRVGPKAVRIRRGDLIAVVKPTYGGKMAEAEVTPSMPIHTTLATIRPLSDEQQRRALDALKASQELIARQRAQRGGKPFDESWPLIRAAREERSKRLL